MKHIFFAICLFISAHGISQEWGTVNKNSVTLKEIAPVWPGCEGKSGSSIDQCFKQKLAQHIAQNYKYPAQAYKNNEQGRVVVEFFVNEQGTIDIKSVSGGSASLQEEAKRNIQLIPKMAKPGMFGGKPKAIKYIVPITFKTGR